MTDQLPATVTDRERILLTLLAAAVTREKADAERTRTYSLGPLMTPAERDQARAASEAAAAHLTAVFRTLPQDLHLPCLDAIYSQATEATGQAAGAPQDRP